MTLKLTRGLWTWAAVLALALLVIIPLPGWQRTCGALAIALALYLAWRWTSRRDAWQRQAFSLADDVSLPPAAYRQPVILVCGDGLQELFETAGADKVALRITPQGCYLRTASPEQLPQMVDSVLARRPHWAGQLSVLYIINPGEHVDVAVMAGQLRMFRHQLALARRHGVVLPLLQATYLQSSHGTGPWFSWEAGAEQPDVRDAGARSSLGEWQRQAADLLTSADRLCTSVQLDNVAEWLAENVQAHLVARDARDPACIAVACAVTLVPALSGTVAGNLWQQWVCNKTGLGDTARLDPGVVAALSFPDPLLPLLRVKVHATPWRRASLIALWLFAAAMLAALVSSAWQNNLLARQISDDLRRYLAIPLPEHPGRPEFAMREAAITALRADAARLDGYYHNGAPLQLGFGLYQGERLRAELLAAIAAYRLPPEAPSAVAGVPGPVRLDSLSLFAVGSAMLKPESTKLLINALVDIKAQPGWLIVIAGHTDATGNTEQNLQLSRARAGAVRDWMQRMGEIPDSCFAVQGFGASQPIASNDTEIGRAANRRVDIRLVPEVGACALPTAAPEGKHQSHSAAVNY